MKGYSGDVDLNWLAATINRKLHCLFHANKSNKKIFLGGKEPTDRGGQDGDGNVYMCIWVQRDDRRGGWLLRKDDFSSCTTYRTSPRPYTRSISILGKSTLGIENRDERASEGGGRVETAGSRWTEGGLRRLCAWGRKRAAKRTKRGERVPCLRKGM